MGKISTAIKKAPTKFGQHTKVLSHNTQYIVFVSMISLVSYFDNIGFLPRGTENVKLIAERVGFEPTVPLTAHKLFHFKL